MSAVPERLAAALSGSYRLERELGAGGMATVYLAEDLKHRRKVAIKVLREDLAASLGSARFLREIETSAATAAQHPHILPCSIQEMPRVSSTIVMLYVEGQSLRDRINREGELPLQDAVRLLAEVADALAYAHDHGVVHRDIKPDNVMLSGRHALVADFGVAKAVSEATGRNTITTLGVAVGTPTYMSPEQAAADPHIDHRSDIYAVGVMAYELLAGRPPFTGATPQQVLAAHVTEAPDPVSKRRPGISSNLEAVVMRCLEKRPADRFQSAHELVSQLEPLGTPSVGITPTNTRPIAAIRRTTRRWPLVAAGVVVLAIGVFIWRRGGQPPTVVLGKASQITSDPGLEILPSLSPDGKFVAYAAGTSTRMRIFVRPVAGGRTIPLTDDTTGAQSKPRFSPDGASVLFLAAGGVFMAPALGGQARGLLPPTPGNPVQSAAWSSDGKQIAIARRDSLFVADLATLAVRGVATGRDLHSCDWEPHGSLVACVSGNSEFVSLGALFGNLAPSTIEIIDIGRGTSVAVTDSSYTNQSPVWVNDGKTIYFISNRDGPRDIYAVSIGSSGRTVGAPVRITTGLNAMTIGLSSNGKELTYALYAASANLWSLPIPTGPPVSATSATAVTTGSQIIEGVKVSRDDKWLVYDSNLRGTAGLYRIALSGGEVQPLSTDSVDEFQPDLSPDGTELAFHSPRNGVRQLFTMPVGGGPIQQVFATSSEQRVADWSPDGGALTYYSRATSNAFVVRRDANRRWQQPKLIATGLIWPRWSPDGKLIVGTSSPARVTAATTSGTVVVVPADSGAMRVLYAGRPGTDDPAAESPLWAPDGQLIYFKSHDAEGQAAIWSIPSSGGTPRLLVRFDDPNRPSYRTELAVDAKRFFFTFTDRQSDIWVMEIGHK